MFGLFRTAQLYPKVNFYLIAIAWIGVLFWLNFTFIEKALIVKVMSGEAILVDLLFGLPLVLMLAVVVYATIYWFLKLIIVYVYPQAIMPASELDEALTEMVEDPELEKTLQAKYGEAYWQAENDQAQKESQESSGDVQSNVNNDAPSDTTKPTNLNHKEVNASDLHNKSNSPNKSI